MLCNGQEWGRCEDGVFVASETCPAACSAEFGCTSCKPGEELCTGEQVRTCLPDGSGYSEPELCDPALGLACSSDGRCVGPCSPSELGHSYVGCEYYPTVTGNTVSPSFDFAVVISNTSDKRAEIIIDGGELAGPMHLMVEPGEVHSQELPWVASLRGCGSLPCSLATDHSRLESGAAYRLRSNRPVVVYQFSPLPFQWVEGDHTWFSASNDASLLLPANALGKDYRVASWPVFEKISHPGLMAVTATEDNTTITVHSKARVEAGGAGAAIDEGSDATYVLEQGDVLELFTYSGDFTGSGVSADKPVQVIGGHFCTQVPMDKYACDRLEESMLPVATLGQSYHVSAPELPALPDGKVQIVRFIAVEDSTAIELDPAGDGPYQLAAAGDFLELPASAADYTVHSDKKLLVVQYMTAQSMGGLSGDPAMATAVPVEQYRTGYRFLTPVDYDTSYVNVVAPASSTIKLDGQTITGFSPVGSSDYHVKRVLIEDNETGKHVITGDEPFGISVYGYGKHTSYWYPGGLDLEPVVID
jgi:hypothetical protein